MKYYLSPSILSADFAHLGDDIAATEKGGTQYLHYDVMDGMFVPSISFGMPVLKSVRKITDLVLDVHLMIEDPDRYIDEFVKSGADIITVHYEACKDVEKTIQMIREKGVKVGVTIKPKTPLSVLEPLLDKVDMILLMTVEPGFGGQAYIPESTDKIRALRKMLNDRGLTTDIEVDGGIKKDNLEMVLDAGANVIVNLSASDEITGKDSYRRNLIGGQSARLVCGYIYADAGEGESSTDLVFAAHNLIAENGTILAQSKRFENEIVTADLDIHRIRAERRRMTTYPTTQEEYEWTEFELKTEETKLERTFAQTPFVPQNKNDRERRCEEILSIQALGLKKRLVHTNCKSLVVGISGGLDSTLALLVAARACDMAGIGRDHILSVTMPCFGTTDRTYQNACELTRRL